ncbi:TraB/VirB10 family protein [Endozoicomonas euniceicola]|uniref:TraB/VirB10 family protein n=1 Tax=Endozoicomonas euniceicola TaxID=1234143 RepID=A0ABY6GT33_9GAMM|nr:TraB/VirB10 family protein [Endozoicomonas euniceicola]UYM15920.1 TraB/VirB10 family protein [Endozoicomonas euniceicola]
MNTLNRYLTPRVRRLGIVLGSTLIIIILIFVTSKQHQPSDNKTDETKAQSVDFTGVPPKELTLNRISADLENINQQQQSLHEQHQKEMVLLQQEIKRLNSVDPAQGNTIATETAISPEPLPPDVLSWNHYNQPPPPQYPEPEEQETPPPPKPIRMLGATFTPPTATDTRADNKPRLLRLPAGSILSGQLITGLDVPTGQGARREPYPVLIRIKASAILPNRYRTNVRECFVLASGYGDLSSERAYLRSETLSCIFSNKIKDKEQVIERPLEGYLAGEDGKAGLRGRLVSKQGQVMAKAAMAGFLGGVSQAFDIKPVPVFSVVPNKNGEIQSPFQSGLKGSEALQSSLIKGSNKALEKLADFYLKLADQMVPVIEISAERKVDLILTRGLQP